MQKQVVPIIFDEDLVCKSKPFSAALQALNFYPVNFYQHLNFIQNLKISDNPKLFQEIIKATT